MKTPREYIEQLEILTDEFSKLSEYWAELIKYQADYFSENRKNFKSDNACQKEFDRTDWGVKMQVCKAKLKSKEKQISTIKTCLRLLENEAKNIY